MSRSVHSPFETMAAAAYMLLWEMLESAGKIPDGTKPSPTFAFSEVEGGLFPNSSAINVVNRALPKGLAKDRFIAAFAPYSKPKMKPR